MFHSVDGLKSLMLKKAERTQSGSAQGKNSSLEACFSALYNIHVKRNVCNLIFRQLYCIARINGEGQKCLRI